MTIPTTLLLTPASTVTDGMGASTATASEFWQLTAGGFQVWEGIPYSLMQQLLQTSAQGGGAADSAIALQLVGYPSRIVSATASNPS